ncbi:hypothetical protein C2G38_2234014 [Gigaspora rosea]|uniref:F-box domain-containing protein n=1 Tax=Gigaspora rosea TaxID=44941 RepID=A0A397TSX3_9GLOM|nr:hypothetical protein C2G38_2234014 [Gigaspora rosea]
MTPFPVEVFCEILKYNDHKTLFSCLLTSRKLCEITVNFESPKLVRTLILGLGSKRSVEQLIPKNQQNLLFNYAQYITSNVDVIHFMHPMELVFNYFFQA